MAEPAIIVGDIKSKSVQINNGATINGRCLQVYADVDVESIFNIGSDKKDAKKKEEAPKITGTNKDAEVEKKPYVRKGAKIGRNDPCPCGSGKKYKNCCGRNK